MVVASGGPFSPNIPIYGVKSCRGNTHRCCVGDFMSDTGAYGYLYCNMLCDICDKIVVSLGVYENSPASHCLHFVQVPPVYWLTVGCRIYFFILWQPRMSRIMIWNETRLSWIWRERNQRAVATK